MKKLLLKCVLLLVLTGSILSAGGAAYRQTNTYRNLERTEETEKYHTMPTTIDIAVFGPSHGRDAFRYPPDGCSFFNFSMSSQTPQYDLMQMREYQDRFHPDTLVVLTVSYLSPFWTDSQDTFSDKQPRYYRILSPKNIVDVDLSHYWLQRFSPLLTEDFPTVVTALFHDAALQPTSDETSGYHETSADVMDSEQARIRKDHWDNCIAGSFPNTNPVMWDSFCEMLSMCRENGWQAVLVTPPYLSEYNACFSDAFYSVFYEQVNALSSEFDVPYLDYSHEPAYAAQYALFRNIDHLNLNGAAQFDARFFADLQAMGLL